MGLNVSWSKIKCLGNIWPAVRCSRAGPRSGAGWSILLLRQCAGFGLKKWTRHPALAWNHRFSHVCGWSGDFLCVDPKNIIPRYQPTYLPDMHYLVFGFENRQQLNVHSNSQLVPAAGAPHTHPGGDLAVRRVTHSSRCWCTRVNRSKCSGAVLCNVLMVIRCNVSCQTRDYDDAVLMVVAY